MRIIKKINKSMNTFLRAFYNQKRLYKAKKPLIENPYQIKKYKIKPFISMQ